MPAVDLHDPKQALEFAWASAGRSLKNEHLADAIMALHRIQRAADRLSELNSAPRVNITLTSSVGMTCRAQRGNDRIHTVLVPLGAIARVRTISRLLLSYWDNGSRSPRRVSSILDPPGVTDHAEYPSALLPLLFYAIAEYGTAESWWAELDALDAKIDLADMFDSDVGELVHLILVHLVGHEVGHAIRRHFELLSDFEAHTSNRLPGSNIRRLLELDADLFAMTIAVRTQVDLVRRFGGDLALGFFRLGYGFSSLFALFDPTRISLMEFAEGGYLHPFLRLEMAKRFAGAALSDYRIEPEAARAKLKAMLCNGLADGAERCISALNWLEYDALLGGFDDLNTSGTGSPEATEAPYNRPGKFRAPLYALRQPLHMPDPAKETKDYNALLDAMQQRYGGFSLAIDFAESD